MRQLIESFRINEFMPCFSAGQRPEYNTACAVIHQVNANGSGYRFGGAERSYRCAHEIHISWLRNSLGGFQWASVAMAREGIRQGRRRLHCACVVRHKPCLETLPFKDLYKIYILRS